jgi:hypothetical protein
MMPRRRIYLLGVMSALGTVLVVLLLDRGTDREAGATQNTRDTGEKRELATVPSPVASDGSLTDVGPTTSHNAVTSNANVDTGQIGSVRTSDLLQERELGSSPPQRSSFELSAAIEESCAKFDSNSDAACSRHYDMLRKLKNETRDPV